MSNLATKPQKNTRWKAVVVDSNGVKSTIRFEAVSRGRARLEIANRGLEFISLDEFKSVLQSDVGGKAPKKVLLHVTRQLSAFTAAGIPVVEALGLIGKHTKNRLTRVALQSMVQDVLDGDSLAMAASRHPRVFPEFYTSILQAAERSGDIREAFETLAVYLDRDLNSTRSVRSALYYPAVLFVLGIAAVAILTIVVIPKFQILFDSIGADLPLPTKILMGIAAFVGQWWPIILLAIVSLAVAIVLLRRTDAGALFTDRILLKIPIVGNLITFIALERFTRILSSLSESGVPLSDSLLLSSSVMGNKVFEKGILETRQGVIRGDGLSTPLEQAKVFPDEAIQIFRVGEESGRLGEQLRHGSDFYSAEVDYRLKNLTSLIEPAVLLIIGGGVGFIAIALVSAMYGIYSAPELQS